jgi:hypothetical protein
MALTLHGTVADNTVVLSRQNTKPLIINGDMAVAQRGTSITANTAEIYTSLDRFKYIPVDSPDNVYTITQDSDVPSGQGFAKSLKVDVATADTSLDSLDGTIIEQRIEAQNLQQLNFGTSSAKSFTLAFWVKSNKTGTYVVRLLQPDNSSKQVSYAYTISSADTWEKKVVNIPGDTAGVITNDNGNGLGISWFLSAGAGLQSGALRSTWTAYANGDAAVGQVNLADSTDNEWYLAGVQLEVGTFDANSIAPFQHESFGDNLTRCQRYCTAITKEASYGPVMFAHGITADVCRGAYFFRAPMRSAPSFTHTGNIIRSYEAATALSSATAVSSRFSHSIDWTGSGLFAANEGILITFDTTAASLIYSAEL